MNGNYTYKDGIVVNASNAQRADEKHERIKKCEHCSDTGLVQIAPNVRGLKKCPYCGGQAGTLVR